MIAFSRCLARPFVLWLLLLCICATAARAQSPTPTPTPSGPLQMAISSPFALTQKPLVLTAKPGRWFPVAVTLSNTGEPVKGEVRLRLLGAGNFDLAPNDFYAPVDLPSNSNKVVWLYARMERPNIAGFEVTFSGRGFSTLKSNAQITAADEESRLIVTIADSDDGLAATLKSLRGQALFRGGRVPQVNPNAQPVRALQADHENVPDRWIGFDVADYVVLGDFVHTSLSPKQLESLRGWVQSGGNLVVVGGNNAARLGASPLRDLWPIQATNSAPATATEVSGLVNRYVSQPKNGADRLGGAPVVLVRGNLTADATLKAGDAQAPLFATDDAGAGRVLFLSFNPGAPPFVGWSGQGDLWRDIFASEIKVRRLDSVDSNLLNYGSTANMPGGGGYGYEENVPQSGTSRLLESLSRAKQLRMPPVSQIAWFLALYVFFLVPVNYAILRLIDRRELAWVTIPLIVAVFSVWAYSVAVSIRGRAILTRQIDIAQSSMGSKVARTDSMLWLYSPRNTSYDLASSGGHAVVSDYANGQTNTQGAFSILEPGDGGSFVAKDAGVLIWTWRGFNAQSLSDLGKGVTLRGNRLSNDAPLDLRGAVWVQDRRVWSLGDIKKGGSVSIQGQGTITSGADLPGAIANASNLPSIFDASTLSDSIPNQALTLALGEGFGKLNSEALLVAWGTNLIAPIGVEDARARNITLWVFRAPKLSGAIAAREATVTRTSFEPFPGGSGGPGVPPGSPGQNYNGGYAFYDAILPAQKNLVLQARGLGIGPNASELNYRQRLANAKNKNKKKTKVKIPTWVHFEVWDARTNQWQPLDGQIKRDKSPAGGWNFRARIDPALARQPDRLLRVRAKLDNSRAQVSSLQIG